MRWWQRHVLSSKGIRWSVEVYVGKDDAEVFGQRVERTPTWAPSEWMELWERVKRGEVPHHLTEVYMDRVELGGVVVRRPTWVSRSDWWRAWTQ